MVWNYRGYGLSTGTPTPSNIRQDGDQILRYLRQTLGLTGKIGVYGRSLGGVVVSHLVDKVDFIFADRTFSNFDVLSNRKFYSSISKYLFKLSSGGWVINNELKVTNKGIANSKGDNGCYKVIITEKVDEVVEIHSSLMTGVAREAIGRKLKAPGEDFYLSRDQLELFIGKLQFLMNLENDLYTQLDWAYHRRLTLQQGAYLMSPSSRFFCMGRGGNTRNQALSGRIQPDIEQS